MTVVHPGTPTAYLAGPSEQVPEGGRLVVDVSDVTLGIFRVRGELYAYENVCPHQGGPVCQGRIVPRVRDVLDEGRRVVSSRFDEAELHLVCAWHGAEFNLVTGAHPTQPRFTLRSFPVEEREGAIYVTV